MCLIGNAKLVFSGNNLFILFIDLSFVSSFETQATPEVRRDGIAQWLRVNITKKKQTHRYREQTSGYQWGEGSGEEQYRGKRLRGTNYYV